MSTMVVSLYGIVLIYICIVDIQQLRISNGSLLILGALSMALWVLLSGDYIRILYGFVALVLGVVIWYLGWWGAGDAKLVAILAINLDASLFLPIALLVLVLGGIQSVITLLVTKLCKRDFHRGIPFSLPISIGMFSGVALSLAGV